jgi:hypothetical protein
MYVRWQQRRRSRPAFVNHHTGPPQAESDVHWRAILVENVRVGGKPVQQHVAYLGGITDSGIKTPTERHHFWEHVTACLDRLHNRLSQEQRQAIEAAVAKRVPPLTTQEWEGAKQRREDWLSILETNFAEGKAITTGLREHYKGIIDTLPNGEPFTTDHLRWRQCQLAYDAEQTGLLKEFASATGMSLRKARQYALMHRIWCVDRVDPNEEPQNQ